MFDLAPHPSAPIKRSRTSTNFQLGPDRWLPPPLEDEHKSYLVELTSEDDPANAKSWPLSRKLRSGNMTLIFQPYLDFILTYFIAFVLGFDTLVASWGSSVYSAAVEPVSLEFGVGKVVALLGLTLYICGFATGPLAFAPLSELYGRRVPITLARFVFTCFMYDLPHTFPFIFSSADLMTGSLLRLRKTSRH
jgi:DHA1 family multidrug resistance protein-like MFS transporter